MHKRNMHHLYNIYKTVSLASPCFDGHKVIQFHTVSRENLQSLTQIFAKKAVFIGISKKVLRFTHNFKSYKQELGIELKFKLQIVEKNSTEYWTSRACRLSNYWFLESFQPKFMEEAQI